MGAHDPRLSSGYTVVDRPILLLTDIRSVESVNDKPRSTRSVRPGVNSSAMFLREAFDGFRDVGAVAPSSISLARAMTAPVTRFDGPRTVLEVGAGTGPITTALLDRLSPTDRLDVVETNPRFATRLRELTRDAHRFGGPRTHVHESRIELIKNDIRYDAIVSGLPFTNFAPGTVRDILTRYDELLTGGGCLTYFTYRGTRRLRSVTASRESVRRHRQVEELLTEYRQRFTVDCKTIWANLPPALVWELSREVLPNPAPSDPQVNA